jgi:hypothetical protein
VMLVATWLLNGPVVTQAIQAPDYKTCMTNEPFVERDIRAKPFEFAGRTFVVEDTQSICMEVERNANRTRKD